MALPRRNDEIPGSTRRLFVRRPSPGRGSCAKYASAVAYCCGGLRGAAHVRNKAEAEGIKSRGH